MSVLRVALWLTEYSGAMKPQVPATPRSADDAREAEVAEAAVEGGVEHDVAGLDVAVEHHVLVLMVDVVEPCSDVHHDVVAASPSEDAPWVLLVGKQVLIKAAVGHMFR
ncbi:hypothetical protein U9M48_012042 [Paspalum notatum var. saurae]|uniref:Uncharacterized protein n=1 Tax=Paspalum notatum var. saurae TaxID=547442 RepID=A0AAQ3WI52_PASNO